LLSLQANGGAFNFGGTMRTVILTLLLVGVLTSAQAFQTEASYYSVESCKREGTWQKWGGKTASGKDFTNESNYCASRDFPFGQHLRITNIHTGLSTVCVVEDIGPSKKLYKAGRRIDLSKSSFAKISSLSKGVVQVEVMPIYMEDKSNVKKSI
jgi:rare lipoprotein A